MHVKVSLGPASLADSHQPTLMLVTTSVRGRAGGGGKLCHRAVTSSIQLPQIWALQPPSSPALAPSPFHLDHLCPQEVGGSTKAAQAAAAIAQQRRPAAPHRLVTWRHIHTGASLAVEVPLSVFRKQRGAVFRKWQQRAWRALHALRCELGEEVWPEGCRQAAAAGAPCWDELEEETAALAKLPFCMPQKVGRSGCQRGGGRLAGNRAKTRGHLPGSCTCLWTGTPQPATPYCQASPCCHALPTGRAPAFQGWPQTPGVNLPA